MLNLDGRSGLPAANIPGCSSLMCRLSNPCFFLHMQRNRSGSSHSQPSHSSPPLLSANSRIDVAMLRCERPNGHPCRPDLTEKRTTGGGMDRRGEKKQYKSLTIPNRDIGAEQTQTRIRSTSSKRFCFSSPRLMQVFSRSKWRARWPEVPKRTQYGAYVVTAKGAAASGAAGTWTTSSKPVIARSEPRSLPPTVTSSSRLLIQVGMQVSSPLIAACG